jgi:predicted aldo/keto reductase-like oxidoreductase
MFQDPEITFARYNRFLTPEQRAANCTECGECEERCPQHIKIMDELKKGHPALVR